MKLSEMNTVEFTEKVCDLVEPIARIMEDKEFVLTIQRMAKEQKKGDELLNITKMAKKLVPLLLRKHQEDTFEVFSILNGKTVEEIKMQPVKQTIEDIKNSIDGELIELFK